MGSPRTARGVLASVGMLAAIAAATPAHADFLLIDDSQPGVITLATSGFFGSPLTLDGSTVVPNGTYNNVYTTLPKGSIFTFTAADYNFSTPYTFSTTYVYQVSGVTVAELQVSGRPLDGEYFSGTFTGYGNSFGAVPSGAVLEPVSGVVNTYGQCCNTTGIEVLATASVPVAVPGPTPLLVIGAGLLAASVASSRQHNRA